MRPVLITLATAWGPRFGGINTFKDALKKSAFHQRRPKRAASIRHERLGE
ncbi:hypothetical protein [Aquaspirillum sp. LM1]|nr:hypothetical protein [Aquaspirillum sp. LM1]